jgi:hypothetical protein
LDFSYKISRQSFQGKKRNTEETKNKATWQITVDGNTKVGNMENRT